MAHNAVAEPHCPAVPPLGSGTQGQSALATKAGEIAGGTEAGTLALKALARRVLLRDRRRDSVRDSAATAPTTTVSLTTLISGPSGTLCAALAAAERGAAAVAGPADTTDAAEAHAIREVDGAEPTGRRGSGPNGKWTLTDYARTRERHLAGLPDLIAAGLLRPPSWADADAIPSPGCRCSCCHGGAWWCATKAPFGWRCRTCHPPDHLRPDEVRAVRT